MKLKSGIEPRLKWGETMTEKYFDTEEDIIAEFWAEICNRFVDGMKPAAVLRDIQEEFDEEDGVNELTLDIVRKVERRYRKDIKEAKAQKAMEEEEKRLEERLKKDFKQQFVTLRAQGTALDTIGQELQIDRQILIKWCREFQDEIQQTKYLYLERTLADQGIMKAQRLEIFATLYAKIKKALETADFSDIPPDRLLAMQLKLLERIDQERKTERLKIAEEDPFKTELCTVVYDHID